ncbi:hypothetical protein [Xanthomonas cannabis]|uniref:hypothetical protein n=1 Tax=Xanthomonas cannabis TaxID=1885674 RepID=UPI00141BB2B4|nr:hypothetical protein [Xanthomonas cannabis]NIK02365.1 hypothetical protein [Xanthomonas cannabis]
MYKASIKTLEKYSRTAYAYVEYAQAGHLDACRAFNACYKKFAHHLSALPEAPVYSPCGTALAERAGVQARFFKDVSGFCLLVSEERE